MRSIFDKTPYLTNQEGLDKAYVSPKYVYQNGETLYIGGTQTARDIWDDLKIPFDKVDQSQRYKDASKIIEQNIVEKHPITNVVAHSLGASVGLKLVDKYPNYPMTTTSYGAPIAVGSNQLISPIISGERYRHPYDGVSGFDYGAKTIPIQDPKVWNPHSYKGYGNKDIN
jgi:pimeloyl-ACP methyl ester carboxylesterase